MAGRSMSPPACGRPTNPRIRKLLTGDVTAKQLELLRKFDYPLSQDLVGSARPTGEGFQLDPASLVVMMRKKRPEDAVAPVPVVAEA